MTLGIDRWVRLYFHKTRHIDSRLLTSSLSIHAATEGSKDNQHDESYSERHSESDNESIPSQFEIFDRRQTVRDADGGEFEVNFDLIYRYLPSSAGNYSSSGDGSGSGMNNSDVEGAGGSVFLGLPERERFLSNISFGSDETEVTDTEADARCRGKSPIQCLCEQHRKVTKIDY